VYLFDSSAIIEILKGNSAVLERYSDQTLLCINLVYGEVYYYCLKANIAIGDFRKIQFEMIEYTIEDIQHAMELLYERKRRIKDFSFIDALVYTIAVKNKLTLVTKDFGFKGLSQVEFIAC